MFGKLKNLFEFSLIEALTIILFAAIGYGFIYKINLYSQLGISWFLGSLSTSYVFFTSLKFILSSVLGISIGFLITKNIPEKYLLRIIFILLLLVFLLGALILFKFELLIYHLGFKSSYIPLFFYGLLTTYYIVVLNHNLIIKSNLENLNLVQAGKVPTIVWVMIISIYFITPALIGNTEAKNIAIKPELILTLVKLKDNSEKWFLVELLNDKALIKKEGVEKIYKLVDYKDIDLYEDVSNKK